MARLSDRFRSDAARLEGRPVIELLLLVGDESKGCRQEALDLLLDRDFDAIYPTLEHAVRNNALADLRNGAMEVLVHFGRKSVPHLVDLLHDGDEEVRNFSTVMLGDIAVRDAVEPLIAALNDPDANVRHGAAEALGRIGDRSALLPLLKLLGEDFWQQYPALAAIREMRDNRAVPYLLPLVNDGMLGEPAIEALAAIGDGRALPSLAALLVTPSSRSETAVRAICTICIGEGGEGRESAQKSPRFRSLLESAPVEENLRRLADGPEADATATAARTLLEIRDGVYKRPSGNTSHEGPMAGHPSVGNVSSIEDATVKAALAEIEAGIPLDVVLMNARSAGDGVEQAIIEAVGRQGNGNAVESLLALLEKPDNRRHVDFAIVHALAASHPGRPVAVNRLKPFTDHPDPDLRRLALQALTGLNTTEALPALIIATADRHWSVRMEALRLLPRVDVKRAEDSLLAALCDSDVLVRKSVIAELGKLGSLKAVVPLVNLLSDNEVGRGAFDALLTIGEAALPELHAHARSSSLEVREWVIDLIGRLGSKKSIPLLRELADSPQSTIRMAVIHAFWNCHDSSVPPILSRLHVNDPAPEVRYAAMVVSTGLDGEVQ